MNGKTKTINFGFATVRTIFLNTFELLTELKNKFTGEIKGRISKENFNMKCEKSNENFEGIFDFDKEKMITGVGVFEWKDKKNKIWKCKGENNFFFFEIFF